MYQEKTHKNQNFQAGLPTLSQMESKTRIITF